jgi:poly-gamma-glutamate synthesis protein (capsule biosynthesis protein)
MNLFSERFLFLILIVLAAIPSRSQDTTRLSLLFAGDVMGHDSQIASAYDPLKKVYDYGPCFQYIKPFIESADIAIANLEVTLAGPPYKGYPQFSSPDNLAITLRDAGFDALVTANNHSADRGKKGIVRTIDVLDSLRIPHTGTFKDSAERALTYPLMLYKNGFSIALLNYTYGTNGIPVRKPNIVNMLDTALIRRDLDKVRESNPDVVIVFTHWGNEYERLPSKAQKTVTDFCFRYGANLVIGAHPHVIQPMEWRKESGHFVVYSLGNFVSGQRKQFTDGGSMAYLELEKVAFSADSADTRITDAGYYLQWVYRTADSNKDYFIIPGIEGDEKSHHVVRDAASKAAFATFLNDSRTLSKKYNVDVPEIRKLRVRPSEYYSVLLLTTTADDDTWKILTSQRAYVWGVDRHDLGNNVYWTSGNFATPAAAEIYLERYKSQHPGARVVEIRNGKLASVPE